MSNYILLEKQIPSILEDERNPISNMANFSALLFNSMQDINWLGFYLFNGKELIVGPFQGKPACVRIPLEKGVCGRCASTKQTIIVEDVDKFPGHIACDVASKSEIVLPIVIGSKLIGVLDIDSPIKSRFNKSDKEGLEILLAKLIENTDFNYKQL